MSAGEVDPNNAAHNLLFEQRDIFVRMVQQGSSTHEQLSLRSLIAICDVLELQIRRIDELEHL